MYIVPRERDILNELRKAQSNKEIAYTLGLKEGTVKVYLARLCIKCNARNRTGLALWAERHASASLAEPKTPNT